MLAGEQPASQVAGQPIRAMRRLVNHGPALAGHVLHPPVVVDITEPQIAAFLPPDRAFRGAQSASEVRGQFLNRLGRGDDLLQRRRE